MQSDHHSMVMPGVNQYLECCRAFSIHWNVYVFIIESQRAVREFLLREINKAVQQVRSFLEKWTGLLLLKSTV